MDKVVAFIKKLKDVVLHLSKSVSRITACGHNVWQNNKNIMVYILNIAPGFSEVFGLLFFVYHIYS